MRALTPATVAPIYRTNYWDAVRGDELPAGVDYVVFDFAVNSGLKRAVAALQRACDVADDGKIGQVTIAAAAAVDAGALVHRICADRLAFLTKLSTWPVFGKGWAARVKAVERAGLGFVVGAPVRAPAPAVVPHPDGPKLVPVAAPMIPPAAVIAVARPSWWDRVRAAL